MSYSGTHARQSLSSAARGLNALPEVFELRRCWSRWTKIIEMFAKRRRGCRFVDNRAYEKLRSELIDACQALSRLCDDERAIYFRNLAELVEPWGTVEMLRRGDRTILAALFDRCRQVEREIG